MGRVSFVSFDAVGLLNLNFKEPLRMHQQMNSYIATGYREP
jgi:hypothetical protein